MADKDKDRTDPDNKQAEPDESKGKAGKIDIQAKDDPFNTFGDKGSKDQPSAPDVGVPEKEGDNLFEDKMNAEPSDGAKGGDLLKASRFVQGNERLASAEAARLDRQEELADHVDGYGEDVYMAHENAVKTAGDRTDGMHPLDAAEVDFYTGQPVSLAHAEAGVPQSGVDGRTVNLEGKMIGSAFPISGLAPDDPRAASLRMAHTRAAGADQRVEVMDQILQAVGRIWEASPERSLQQVMIGLANEGGISQYHQSDEDLMRVCTRFELEGRRISLVY